jgi:hypothetical protein
VLAQQRGSDHGIISHKVTPRPIATCGPTHHSANSVFRVRAPPAPRTRAWSQRLVRGMLDTVLPGVVGALAVRRRAPVVVTLPPQAQRLVMRKPGLDGLM